ncbi:MAG: DUF2059 domain-containing protein [Firmicutes bacterium]|nr:DUF2059 domain-containing protein [Bacillota bacterium]
MKKLSFAALIVCFLFITASAGFCDISQEKKRLILELLKLTKVEESLQANIDQLMNEKESAYSKLISEELLKEGKNDNNGDSKDKVRKTMSGILSKVKTKMLEKLDLGQLLVDVYLPLYDKYFTENDLKSLVDFYNSPIGGKMLKVMPQIAGEAGKQTADYLRPRFSKAFNETLGEVINEDKGKIIEELQGILDSLKK